tara:strand:+ start:6857 stop:8098 length:1242 start_codon:yes stop_codon:yes gene_type:complete
MSARKRTSHNQKSHQPKLRHERPKGKSFEETALLVLGLLAAVMLGISLFTLNTETGPLANLKVLLITVSASFAAYGINKVSVEKLAPRAALGFRIAGFVALTGMSVSGVGMFIGSFSGMVYPDVQLRVLDEAGHEQTNFIRVVNDAALVSTRVAPVVQGLADEVETTTACEIATSCLSRQGNGGRGDIAIALEGFAAQARSVATAFERGTFEREQLLADLNDLNGEYQDILADTDRSIMARRAALQALHSEMTQMASALREALPLALLASFTDELHTGTSIAGNAAGTQRLNAFLRGIGDQLQDALGDIEGQELTPPTFPARPGMLDSLRFIADFAAIAAVIAVAELCLPMALFVTTYLTLVWEIEKRSPPRDENDDDDPDFDGLLDLSPVPAHANGALGQGQDHSSTSRGRK